MTKLIGLLCLTQVAFASASKNWETIYDQDGIKVERREVEGTPLVEVRGSAILPASIKRSASILFDCENAPKWIDRMAECRVLSAETPYKRVTYTHFNTPFVIKDREFVSEVKLEVKKAESRVEFSYHSVEHTQAPKTDYVRGEIKRSHYTFKKLPPKGDGTPQTELMAEAFVDPKGTVPKWIVKIFQSKWPAQTIASLRKRLHDPNVREFDLFEMP